MSDCQTEFYKEVIRDLTRYKRSKKCNNPISRIIKDYVETMEIPYVYNSRHRGWKCCRQFHLRLQHEYKFRNYEFAYLMDKESIIVGEFVRRVKEKLFYDSEDEYRENNKFIGNLSDEGILIKKKDKQAGMIKMLGKAPIKNKHVARIDGNSSANEIFDFFFNIDEM